MDQPTLDKLGIKLPIIQAPMAGVANPKLASAVSNCGALGSLGLGSSTVEQAQEYIEQTKQLTNKAFNVNMFCHTPAKHDKKREQDWLNFLNRFFKEFDATPPDSLGHVIPSFIENQKMLDMLIEQRPPIISFHFGLPDQTVIQKLKSLGIILMASATNLHDAKTIENAGLDFIIAQGWEAGGHRGVFNTNEHDTRLSTFALLSILNKKCSLPIIAAGGIMNGAGINAALSHGACAAQMGTAFIACPESSANQAYVDALTSNKSLLTEISSVISGRPARGMVNRIHIEIDIEDKPSLPDYPICYEATKALNAAASANDNYDFAPQWAGQGAPLTRVMPAAELIQQLQDEMLK